MTINVLHVTASLGGGGVAKLLVNYSEEIPTTQITSDFIVHGSKVGIHEQYFLGKGGRIFHAPPKKTNPIKNIIFISRVIAKGNYDVIHTHQNFSNVVPLILAKIMRVPVRISHGHGFPNASRLKGSLSRFGIQWSATDFFACTEDVGQWLHPKKWKKAPTSSFIMTNAINLRDFTFDLPARLKWRRELKIGNKPTLIQVGRLSEEKNYTFSISLLNRLREEDDWQLVIAGEGPQEDLLKSMVEKLELKNSVKFLGYQKNIPELLSAADIFLMPSFSEGLSLAAIEAQASGITVMASDTLTQDVVLSDLVNLLPLNIDDWQKQINQCRSKNLKRTSELDSRLEDFHVESAAPKYIDYLKKALSRKSSVH